MTDLARALLEQIAGDPVALARLRELVAMKSEKNMITPKLMTITAAAQTLGCSNKTVRRRIVDRSLPAVVDHGRTMIRSDELSAYIERLERTGAPSPQRRRPRQMREYDFLRE